MQMVGSALHTADRPDQLEVVTYIDYDDTSYDGIKMDGWSVDWVKVRGPREIDGSVNLSEMWNRCWEHATGEIYMHCGDDIVFRTDGWDTDVRKAINQAPGKIAFVWCDDGSPNHASNNFGTHGFVHRNWTNVIGRFVPPYFVSDFNDTWFNDVAEMVGCRHFLPMHLTEHMHYIWGKAQVDMNTQQRLARHEAEKPEVLYHSKQMYEQRAAEAVMLTQAIEEATCASGR